MKKIKPGLEFRSRHKQPSVRVNFGKECARNSCFYEWRDSGVVGGVYLKI